MHYEFSVLGVSGDTVYLPPQTDDNTVKYLPLTGAFHRHIKLAKATDAEYELILRRRGGFRTLAAVFAKADAVWSLDHDQLLRPYVMLFRTPLLFSLWAVLRLAIASGNLSLISCAGVRMYRKQHMQIQHEVTYATAAHIFRFPVGVTYLEQDSPRTWFAMKADGKLMCLKGNKR